MNPAAGTPSPWHLQAVHIAVPGRARFRLTGLRGKPGLAQDALGAVRSVAGIHAASANATTGSLLVAFDRSEAFDSVKQRLAEALRQRLGRDIACDAGHTRGAARAASAKRGRPKVRSPAVLARSDSNWHTLPLDDVLQQLDVDARAGLNSADAAERLLRYGPNALSRIEGPTALQVFVRQFTTLPVGMLAVSGAIALATGGVLDAAAIASVVLINSAIGFETERRSEQTIAALAAAPPGPVQVYRGGRIESVPAIQVVPGDILNLQPGARVPADARVVSAHRLMTDEATLTGESMPVPKRADSVHPREEPLADRDNMVFNGTSVTGGSGRAAVVATGTASELGRIQAQAGQVEAPETPMQRQLGQMGAQLAVLSAVACAAVFGVGLLRRYSMLDMLKSSISLGVAAVPEGLPTVATTTLALGIREMARQNVAVRQLSAVETLGSVQVLCLDKTGTLTQNRMDVVALHADGRRFTVDGGTWTLDGEPAGPGDSATLRRLLETLALCNESQLADWPADRPADQPAARGDGPRFAGSPTENALLQLAVGAGVDIKALRRRHPLLKIRYRSEQRQYMVTHHRNGKRRLVAVKGSPTELLALCSSVMIRGRRRAMTDALQAAMARENERWAGEALRVLGVAMARIDDGGDWREAGLTWLGLVGMTDPLRDSMPEFIAVMQRAGIRTVMITGDQSATAYAVGQQLGLSGDEPLRILDSTQFDRLPPELRRALAQETHVFARVSPSHKLEIVRTLQESGQVVAMTGDGVNDGPALKAADVGVALGGAGQDVARSLADVVLEDDHIATMESAVAQGRTIYTNIRKSVHYMLSTNFSEIEVMLVALALGLGSPLNPMQLLWVNLLTDVFPGLALALEAPEPDVMQRQPRDPAEPIIRRQDLRRMAVESGVISAGALASYAWGLLRYGPGASASGMAFNTLTTAQLLHALLCRSDRAGLRQGGRQPNRYLDAALGLSLLAQAGTLVLPPLRRLLGVGPVGLLDLPVMAAGSLGPLLLNDWLKRRSANDENPRREENLE